MPNTGRRPRLAQKAKLRRFFAEISLVDDFQCHGAAQIDVKRPVSNAHRTATQFDRFPAFARHQLVVVKSLHRLFRCRLERVLSRRLAGLNPASKTLAKHADWTEFHGSRKLVTAARAGALGLRVHGSDRASEAIKASQRAWSSSSVCPGAGWESGAGLWAAGNTKFHRAGRSPPAPSVTKLWSSFNCNPR